MLLSWKKWTPLLSCTIVRLLVMKLRRNHSTCSSTSVAPFEDQIRSLGRFDRIMAAVYLPTVATTSAGSPAIGISFGKRQIGTRDSVLSKGFWYSAISAA